MVVSLRQYVKRSTLQLVEPSAGNACALGVRLQTAYENMFSQCQEWFKKKIFWG